MAVHPLPANFASFFGKLNPSTTTETTAARELAAVRVLIESRVGASAVLEPSCFLQGSYGQQTAIYTLRNVNIVALCRVWQLPNQGTGVGEAWTRDRIFETIAQPFVNSLRYRRRVRYGPTSMCVKIDGDVSLEILPAVYAAGNTDSESEPFRLFRPETAQWVDGFARYHQRWLARKNGTDKTGGRFIPAIKVLKHLRSHFGHDAVSFYIECLLFSLPDTVFTGGPADYIPRVLAEIASTSAADWYARAIKTPCGDRNIFAESEWTLSQWELFHRFVSDCARVAQVARDATNRETAIQTWQSLLGQDFFPHL
jgi:hypothetical protein